MWEAIRHFFGGTAQAPPHTTSSHYLTTLPPHTTSQIRWWECCPCGRLRWRLSGQDRPLQPREHVCAQGMEWRVWNVRTCSSGEWGWSDIKQPRQEACSGSQDVHPQPLKFPHSTTQRNAAKPCGSLESPTLSGTEGCRGSHPGICHDSS